MASVGRPCVVKHTPEASLPRNCLAKPCAVWGRSDPLHVYGLKTVLIERMVLSNNSWFQIRSWLTLIARNTVKPVKITVYERSEEYNISISLST